MKHNLFNMLHLFQHLALSVDALWMPYELSTQSTAILVEYGLSIIAVLKIAIRL